MIIYKEILSFALEGLIGVADIDEHYDLFSNVDNNSEEEVKIILEQWVLPNFLNKNESFKLAFKNSLGYYLVKDNVDWEDICDSNLIPFDCPDESILLFQWIWDLYFPNESYRKLEFENLKFSDSLTDIDNLLLKKV